MSDARSPMDDQSLSETMDHRGGDPDDSEDTFDRLTEEFADRCRRGEDPSIAEYAARHPEHGERIRRLLPTVAMMEQLKRGALATQEKGPERPPPEHLGEFRILRELGRGGMGVVYEAVQESLGRHVALKVVHHVHLDARRLERFRREAQAVAQLHHTNIVPIFAVGEHEGLPYYAMQYIRGSGLDAWLDRWRGTESAPHGERARLVADLGRQAAEALQYAHEQGVLHRDIKPANLLVDEHRTLWVTDFGLAKLVGHEDLTASGDVIGTLRYLAPEALRGETGPRSDVYSLGLTLYELLTLSAPFGDLSPSELLHRVNEGGLPRPRRLDPKIPRDLETIVMKSIARDPSDRYETAGVMAGDLQRFLDDRPVLARRASAPERLWRWSRRHRAVAALSAVALGSVLLASIVGWVGYLTTTRALKQADANVSLSLAIFQELFDQLASKDSLPPPPLGGSVRDSPDGHGPRPSDHHPDDGGGTEFNPGGPGGRPPGPLRRDSAERDSALLRAVLNFYEQFGRQNAANPKLQGEAAWAHRKVGALYERLGRAEDAEAAYSRAIDMFEALVDLHPEDPEYRVRLVKTYDMADPWTSDPASLATLEVRLRRACSLIDGLMKEMPEDPEYALTRLHLYTKLGVTLGRRGELEGAAACYREMIAFSEGAIRQWPRDGRLRIDRAIAEEALARLRIGQKRHSEARALLESAFADLHAMSSNAAIPRAPRERFEGISEAFRELGDPGRAEEMLRRTEEEPGPSGPARSPRTDGGRPRFLH